MPYHIRPITPADAARERAFIESLSAETRYRRFMHILRDPSPEFIERLVTVDGRRTMALVATVSRGTDEDIIAVARYCADETGTACEFAIVVGDDWQCRGIGTTLAPLLFDHAQREGFDAIYGVVQADNQRMIELAEYLGLSVEPPEAGQATVRAVRRLR